MNNTNQIKEGKMRANIKIRNPTHVMPPPPPAAKFDTAVIANMQKTIDEANQEIENLKTDIDTYMAIAKDQLTEIQELRSALSNLLQDTQHQEHNCGDADCPVTLAYQALAISSQVSEKAK